MKEKRVWWRRDVLPPAHWDRIGLRAIEQQLHGRIIRTRIFQYSPVRVPHLVLSAEGEGLVAGTVRDLDEDGLPEVLLTLAPPARATERRFVVLTWSAWDRAYVVAADLRPAAGARIRLVEEWLDRRSRVRYSVAIDEPPAGRVPGRTRLYLLSGERLVETPEGIATGATSGPRSP